MLLFSTCCARCLHTAVRSSVRWVCLRMCVSQRLPFFPFDVSEAIAFGEKRAVGRTIAKQWFPSSPLSRSLRHAYSGWGGHKEVQKHAGDSSPRPLRLNTFFDFIFPPLPRSGPPFPLKKNLRQPPYFSHSLSVFFIVDLCLSRWVSSWFYHSVSAVLGVVSCIEESGERTVHRLRACEAAYDLQSADGVCAWCMSAPASFSLQVHLKCFWRTTTFL